MEPISSERVTSHRISGGDLFVRTFQLVAGNVLSLPSSQETRKNEQLLNNKLRG